MLSCARATRGLRRPSLDTRSGRPSSPPSRKRWNSGGCSMRAVKDSLLLPLEESGENRNALARASGIAQRAVSGLVGKVPSQNPCFRVDSLLT